MQKVQKRSQPRITVIQARTAPGVRAVRRMNGAYALTVERVHLTVPALLDHLEEARAPLEHLTTHSATLEDVFVTLTGRRLRD